MLVPLAKSGRPLFDVSCVETSADTRLVMVQREGEDLLSWFLQKQVARWNGFQGLCLCTGTGGPCQDHWGWLLPAH